MKSNIRIKPTGSTWKLDGTTVVKSMNSTEMLFRIATMAHKDFDSLVDNLSDKQLHDIVMEIRAHRKEGQDAAVISKGTFASVTDYVVKKHITKNMGVSL